MKRNPFNRGGRDRCGGVDLFLQCGSCRYGRAGYLCRDQHYSDDKKGPAGGTSGNQRSVSTHLLVSTSEADAKRLNLSPPDRYPMEPGKYYEVDWCSSEALPRI